LSETKNKQFKYLNMLNVHSEETHNEEEQRQGFRQQCGGTTLEATNHLAGGGRDAEFEDAVFISASNGVIAK
jgi:hypothetical protein